MEIQMERRRKIFLFTSVFKKEGADGKTGTGVEAMLASPRSASGRLITPASACNRLTRRTDMGRAELTAACQS